MGAAWPRTERRDGDAKRPKAQERRPESTGACSRKDGVCPVTTHILIFFSMVIVLGTLMQVLAPENKSCEGRIGSMLTDIGSFHCSVIFCSVTFPDFVILLRPSYANVKRGTAGLL
uniref:Uncharacterized protein n=1 Tax=Arundo donax TaxID=35708 RepID=A0A0A8ZI82_ARUDO